MSMSPSTSVAAGTTATEPSSASSSDWSAATGASLTAETVTETEPTAHWTGTPSSQTV